MQKILQEVETKIGTFKLVQYTDKGFIHCLLDDCSLITSKKLLSLSISFPVNNVVQATQCLLETIEKHY